MNLRLSILVLGVLVSLGGGVAGTWFFATWKSLSQPLRDFWSMTLLGFTLLISGILIVAILIRIGTQPPRSR